MKPLSFVALALTALIAGTAVSAVGCSSVGADGESLNETEVAPTAGDPSNEGASGALSDAGATSSKAAYRGNPLCGASLQTCFPDPLDIGADSGSDAGPALTCVASTSSSIDAGADGDEASDASSPAPAKDSGHPVSACRVRGATPVPECMLAGTGTDGSKCALGSDCAAGYECVGDGVCRAYCCSGECPTGGSAGKLERATHFCDVMTVFEASAQRVPACNAVRSCSLLGDAECGKGETCSIVAEDGTTSCVATGTARAGDSCDDTHCESGLVCLGQVGIKKCFTLCNLSGSDCGEAAQCRTNSLFKDSSVGVCQPKM